MENTTCTCDDSYEEHSCPYQLEINDNEEFVCGCYEYCRQQCLKDI